MAKNWIKGAIKHPGALHKSLGVPQGQKIPAAKLEKASHSSDPTLRRRADLAKTLKGFHGAPSGRGTPKEMGMAQRAGMRQGAPTCTFCGKKHPGFGEHKGAQYGAKVKGGQRQGSMSDTDMDAM